MTQKVFVMATLEEDNYVGVDYFRKQESVDARSDEDHPQWEEDFNTTYHNGLDHVLEFDDSVDLVAAGFKFSD